MYRRRKKVPTSTPLNSISLNMDSDDGKESRKRSSSPDLFSSPSKVSCLEVESMSPTGSKEADRASSKPSLPSDFSAEDKPQSTRIQLKGISFGRKKEASQVPSCGTRVPPTHFSTYLEELLTTAGIEEDPLTNSYILKNDQAIFIRRISKALTEDRNKRSPETCVKLLISDMTSLYNDNEKFKMALVPTKTDPDSNIARGEFQEPLVRLLLSVDVLQSSLLSFLLKRLAEFASPKDEEDTESIQWTRLILQQLRYLNILDESSSSLTKELFDILHSSEDPIVQTEIINYLPDIVSDDQRGTTAEELIELMVMVDSLTPAILVALSNLCLESENLSNVQIRLIKSLSHAPLEHIPAFVRFIITGLPSPYTDELLNGLRSELIICQMDGVQVTQKKKSSADLSSTQVLVFEKLRDSVLMSRKLSEAWLKNIVQVKKGANHRPIDLIMMVILHSTSTDLSKKKVVETSMKNKIKSGHFKSSLIKDTASCLTVVLKQYFNDVLKLMSILLQSPDQSVSRFGADFYLECFTRMDGIYCKLIVTELLDNVRMAIGNARPALTVLHSLTTQFYNKVAPYVTFIMLLCELTCDLKVPEVRELMDILCIIAYGDPNETSLDLNGLQDELYMMVQKQLSSPSTLYFRSGIISALTLIRHMAAVKEGCPNETPDAEDEDIMLSDNAQRAFSLLDLVLIGTRTSPETQVFMFDQLSYVIMSSDNLDKCFIRKVSLLMQNNLQNNFIIATSDFTPGKDGLEIRALYCLDVDLEDPIVLNLADAVLRETNSSPMQMPCCTLASLVRVVRGLEIADLTEIDALLGCGIAMPNPALLAKFNSLEPYYQKMALDILFHCCNWFREIINCFVYLIREGSPEKVMTRVRCLVHLQNTIANCLPRIISYSPPVCYFDGNPAKSNLSDKWKKPGSKKRGRKKAPKEREEGDDEENADETAAPPDSEEEEDEVESLEVSTFRQYLRELDFDVCLILTQPLIMNPKQIQDSDFNAEFGPSELLFILEDLVIKLKFVLTPKKSSLPLKSQPVGFENLRTVPLDLIVKNFSKLAHHLANHLRKIIEFSHNLIEVHDNIWDAPGMFPPGIGEVKQCLALILMAFNAFFSWPDITSEVNRKIFLKTLVKLGGKNLPKDAEPSLNEALRSALNYLADISKCVMDLSSAVNLVLLINTLTDLQDVGEDAVEVDVDGVCQRFLERKWYTSKRIEAKGAEVNRQQSLLLEVYLTRGKDPIQNITRTMSSLTEQVEEITNEAGLTSFPQFNKANLHIFIQTVCKCLTVSTKKSLDNKDYQEQLKIWTSVVDSLQNLVIVVKAQDSKSNLRPFLKGCIPVLKLFLSHGMNLFSTMFKMEAAIVTQILKKLQVVTRYIQTVCNFSKITKDSSLIQQLPGIRGTLESILLSVKSMVLQNKCTDAFFMGSMRNKDLRGEVIESQVEEDEETAETEEQSTRDGDSSEEEEEEEDVRDDNSEAVSDTI